MPRQVIENLSENEDAITEAAAEAISLATVDECQAIEQIRCILAERIYIGLPAGVHTYTRVIHSGCDREIVSHRQRLHHGVISLGAMLGPLFESRRFVHPAEHFRLGRMKARPCLYQDRACG